MALRLKNVGDQVLSGLEVKLESLDTGCIRVFGRGTDLPRLEPGQEQMRDFQASLRGTGEVYVSIEGDINGERFHWETPSMSIQVGGQPAELVSLFALGEPRARLGEPITCEATVRGLVTNVSLVLEFWAEMPSGELRSLAKEGIGRLVEGEQARFTTEITPREQGLYVLHAYLYHGARRIGHRVEYLSIAL
jgi:hypothetical protein